MDNVTIAKFTGSRQEITVSKAPYQWSYGQLLRITGLDLPDGVEVHFSLSETTGLSYRVRGTKIEDYIQVEIPQFIFENECPRREYYKAYAFIYYSNDNSGETTHKIILNIKTRPKPDDYIYSGEEVKTYKTLENRINYLEENGVSKPDWNQNDETAKDYIKNRPFYEKEYTITDTLIDFFQESFPHEGFHLYNLYQTPINENSSLRIIFDGEPYFVEDATDIYGKGFIGNTSLLPVNEFTSIERLDTGEAFCIISRGYASGIYEAHFFVQKEGIHSFKIEILEKTPHIKQLDEKFIPDTIARTDDITILPIERLSDFGGSAERGSSGTIDLKVNASMQNPTNYLFKTVIDNGSKGLKLSFVNSDGTKRLLMMGLNGYNSLLYNITNDTKKKCIIIYEHYFGNSYEIFYDDSGNFVSNITTSNVTSYNVLSSLNFKTKSDAYTPSAATDVATKEYVDNAIQSLILTSSTEGSDKKFKITVDDTGTLTATPIE